VEARKGLKCPAWWAGSCHSQCRRNGVAKEEMKTFVSRTDRESHRRIDAGRETGGKDWNGWDRNRGSCRIMTLSQISIMTAVYRMRLHDPSYTASSQSDPIPISHQMKCPLFPTLAPPITSHSHSINLPQSALMIATYI